MRLSLAVPTAPSASSTTSPSTPAALPPCRADSRDASLPRAPGEACRFETIAGLRCHRTEPVGGFRWPRVDRHAGRPDRVRRRGVSCLLGTTWPDERDHQRRRRGSRGQRLDRHRRRRRRQADEERLRQLQGGGRTQARLRDVDFAESDRSSARRRRVAGAQRVRRRAFHVALVQYSGTGELGAPSTTCSRTTLATCGLAHRADCCDSRKSTSVAQLARARPKAIYSIANGLPTARVAPSFEDSRGDVWMTCAPRDRPPRRALATFDRPFSSVSGDRFAVGVLRVIRCSPRTVRAPCGLDRAVAWLGTGTAASRTSRLETETGPSGHRTSRRSARPVVGRHARRRPVDVFSGCIVGTVALVTRRKPHPERGVAVRPPMRIVQTIINRSQFAPEYPQLEFDLPIDQWHAPIHGHTPWQRRRAASHREAISRVDGQ